MTLPAFAEEYRTIDKAEWGPGPWNDELDKSVWVDETTGLDCMIVRNRHGALCGYVGVEPGHLLHGKDYDAVDSEVDVHGGLTFAGECQPAEDPSKGICHVPRPGHADALWWFGFDCAHSQDLSPGPAAYLRSIGHGGLIAGEVYRTVDYVTHEVRNLARQVAEA